MSRREELTEEQGVILAPLIAKPIRRPDGHGRPEKHSDRAALNGILGTPDRSRLERGELQQIIRELA